MKLSEQLKQDNDCGDFGKALEGYSERAAELEELVEAIANTGNDFGFGKFEIDQSHVEKARAILDRNDK
jgi:hypothetical protein